ncbi:methyltransferase family protein [Flavobacterium cauense R2A-7]|uniref:Methyltransferase family protein n=1 Tax=Flavobacterium cauense R2A-7 TaxID=1341154 RepID=V6RWC9_9FLAO|nr:class I SAM-dependent methyltransferase [Flavobacterium cauense]ESU18783.1 methyltransferase family protein [Flavobacterium cauense R2A-7]KGO81745.1 methyltransferase type 11 [Flavobacterium cauense R2A-7]TWI13776.1 methyltransferase family protein [Flavobacterium cauense R2A-7]
MDKTQKAVEVFNKCANLYEERFMDFDLYNDTFDLFCKSIENQNAAVLELACGPGNITKHLLQQRPDFKILGTDLAPNMIELAQKNNPTATFQLLDCRDSLKLNKIFDGIMCGFGLPYLSKEEAIQLIKDAGNCLNKNGVLYLSTMEDDYGKSGLKKGSTGDEIFMHYHQEDYLAEALKQNGFKIIALQRKKFPEQNGTYTTDLILIAKKIK